MDIAGATTYDILSRLAFAVAFLLMLWLLSQNDNNTGNTGTI